MAIASVADFMLLMEFVSFVDMPLSKGVSAVGGAPKAPVSFPQSPIHREEFEEVVH